MEMSFGSFPNRVKIAEVLEQTDAMVNRLRSLDNEKMNKMADEMDQAAKQEIVVFVTKFEILEEWAMKMYEEHKGT